MSLDAARLAAIREHAESACVCSKADLADLLAAHDALTAQVAAARRLLFGEYPDWAMSGGDEECEHGIHTAIPCRACDMDRLGEASA